MKNLFAKDNLIIFKYNLIGSVIWILVTIILGLGLITNLSQGVFVNIYIIFLFMLWGCLFTPYITLTFFQKGIVKLNEKENFTNYSIKKRQLLFGMILNLIVILILSIIPVIGPLIAIYIHPLLDDIFIYQNLKMGTMDLNLKKFTHSFQQYRMYALKLLGLMLTISIVQSTMIMSLTLSNNLLSMIIFGVNIIISLLLTLYVEAFNATKLLKGLKKTN